MTAADSRIQKLVTPRGPLHVLTLTPFYPVRGDDAQGCFVAEPLAELARLGVTNTVRAVKPFYRGGAPVSDSAVGARGVRFFSIPGGRGLSSAGAFLFSRLLPEIRRLHGAAARAGQPGARRGDREALELRDDAPLGGRLRRDRCRTPRACLPA